MTFCDSDIWAHCGAATKVVVIMRRKPGKYDEPRISFRCDDHTTSLIQDYDPDHYFTTTRSL